jgi:hypothetical protein
MAYNFDGVDDQLGFALGPFSSGYSAGPITIAMLYKPGNAFTRPVVVFTTSADGFRMHIDSDGSSHPRLVTANGNNVATAAIAYNTTGWWLIVATWAGSGNPRWHIHDGTSWNHASFADAATTSITSTDKLKIATRNGASYFAGDIVCTGIKKADSADLTVETLSRTSFAAWAAFGFDWLIGFETSATLVNRASPGSGNETSRVGTTVSSDPPGWSWSLAPPTSIKTVQGLPVASVKTVQGLAKASVKTIQGVA